MIYRGIYWAERTHDVALVDDTGQLPAKRHITDDAARLQVDHDKYRRLVRALGVKPLIARRGTEHGSGLAQRRVVERAFAHLHWFRRLRIRWKIRDDIHEAFLTLGCALISWRRLSQLT